MRVLATLIFAVSLLPLSASAQVYTAENRLIVAPLTNTTFEVIEARGEGARGIWCAAASYAQEILRAPGASRLYVKTARGPSISGFGRKGVVFTINASELSVPPSQSTSVSVRIPGQGLPVHHARQFCIDYLLDLFDRF